MSDFGHQRRVDDRSTHGIFGGIVPAANHLGGLCHGDDRGNLQGSFWIYPVSPEEMASESGSGAKWVEGT